MSDYFQHDETYMLAPDGAPVYAAIEGRRAEAASLQTGAPKLATHPFDEVP